MPLLLLPFLKSRHQQANNNNNNDNRHVHRLKPQALDKCTKLPSHGRKRLRRIVSHRRRTTPTPPLIPNLTSAHRRRTSRGWTLTPLLLLAPVHLVIAKLTVHTEILARDTRWRWRNTRNRHRPRPSDISRNIPLSVLPRLYDWILRRDFLAGASACRRIVERPLSRDTRQLGTVTGACPRAGVPDRHQAWETLRGGEADGFPVIDIRRARTCLGRRVPDWVRSDDACGCGETCVLCCVWFAATGSGGRVADKVGAEDAELGAGRVAVGDAATAASTRIR